LTNNNLARDSPSPSKARQQAAETEPKKAKRIRRKIELSWKPGKFTIVMEDKKKTKEEKEQIIKTTAKQLSEIENYNTKAQYYSKYNGAMKDSKTLPDEEREEVMDQLKLPPEFGMNAKRT
jgi:hypothetical protein